jgi:transcriptional antiterminator
MKTFAELHARLSSDLTELGKFEASRLTTIEKRHIKEQAIGRLCYEAEEDLDPLELNALKRLLGVSRSQWQTYKAKFIAGSSLKSSSRYLGIMVMR